MSKKVKRILIGSLIGLAVIGLFTANIKICYATGAKMRVEREAKAEKARKTAIKMEQAEMVGKCVENAQRAEAEELAKKEMKEQLQKELKEDAEKHKNDKSVQATKQLTQQEKEDLNKG